MIKNPIIVTNLFMVHQFVVQRCLVIYTFFDGAFSTSLLLFKFGILKCTEIYVDFVIMQASWHVSKFFFYTIIEARVLF